MFSQDTRRTLRAGRQPRPFYRSRRPGPRSNRRFGDRVESIDLSGLGSKIVSDNALTMAFRNELSGAN